MATTLLTAEEMFEETIRKVSSSPDEWLRFLNTASRVYQYSFDDQLMIYAQRPNAVGCTSFQTWKKTNHYVKQGTAGIALIHTVNGRKKLRYVYDYKDTGIVRGVPVTEVRKPYLWQIDEEDKKDVSDHLQRRYHIKGQEADLATMLKKLTEEIIEDTMAEEVPKLLRDRQDSYLEDLDQDTIRLEYRELFLSTAWYLLLSRCGIDPGEYMYLEDFRSITDFNNEEVLLRLGSPISEHCASILKEIGLYLFQKNLQKNRAETIVGGRAKEYNQDRQIPVQKEAEQDEINLYERRRRSDVSRAGEKEELNQKLQILLQTQYKHPLISTYYFTPDARKQGGHYEKKTEYVKRIDPVKEYIIMKDDTIIRFHYIKELQGEIFNKVLSF